MPTAKVSQNYQVVIPKEIREKIPFKKGELLHFKVSNGKIIVTPVRVVPAAEGWYWTKGWQKKVRRARGELRRGKAKAYRSVEELKRALGD